MHEISIDQLKSALKKSEPKVDALDFALQKRKMTEVFGWHQAVVDAMEEQYRKFLSLSHALKTIKSNLEIVPNRLVDEFWHLHVMDTAKYHDDCMYLFEEYFHHYPYFGFVNEADTAAWKDSAAEAHSVWKAVYGEDLYSDQDEDAYEMDRKFHAEISASILASPRMSAARCRTQCKPVKCR